MICSNLEIKNNVLFFGGKSTVELSEKYGSPIYVMDEVTIRKNCRKYLDAMNKYFDGNAKAFYASKACSFKKMYDIVGSEGMCADVVSVGEIYTAKSAGFPMENLCFHSNSKNDFDINFAIENGVGCFAVDNLEELESINRIAGEKGIKQKIIFRVTPGIDTHTYEAVNTGKVDSKFGFPIETGAAMKIAEIALTKENIILEGFHCHVGSQLFESSVFIRSAEIMLQFIADVKTKTGYEARVLDLGGGYGVRYTENDPTIDIEDNIRQVAEYVKSKCAELSLNVPEVHMEPGRSIVADAGITLYRVSNVKVIEGYKNYVAIDGGMTDNPRYALYGSQYTVVAADKADEKCDFLCDLVGRCCESGDIIQPKVMLPQSVGRGDLVAVLTTGAYNYSMASNYNRIPRLPVVMVNGATDYLAVRGESLEDIIRNDL